MNFVPPRAPEFLEAKPRETSRASEWAIFFFTHVLSYARLSFPFLPFLLLRGISKLMLFLGLKCYAFFPVSGD